MSKQFNELPEGQQMDVEQDYFDSKNEKAGDLEPKPYIGERVKAVIVGHIVGIEEDVWDKTRTLIKIRMENKDVITVDERLIERIANT